ncbi:MAG: hypothetical protein ACM3N4_12020 [Nitrososphaerota archaeon]
MNTPHKTHPIVRRLSYFLAGLALLAAGYAGMQLAAPSHATAGASANGGLVIECPSIAMHC